MGKKDARRIVREQLAKERRRRRNAWTAAAVVAVLVAAGLIGWGVQAAQEPDSYTAPPGASADGSGIVIGSGPVRIDVYEDFMCPVCKQFERASAATIAARVDSGKATVAYHPVAFLDRMSEGTRYSTRAAAISGCAAAGGKYREFATALFERQPAEGTAGLTDDQLIQVGTEVGLGGSFAQCARDGAYKGWVSHVTDEAVSGGVTGTPTVRVDGEVLPNPTPEAIAAAVAG